MQLAASQLPGSECHPARSDLFLHISAVAGEVIFQTVHVLAKSGYAALEDHNAEQQQDGQTTQHDGAHKPGHRGAEPPVHIS